MFGSSFLRRGVQKNSVAVSCGTQTLGIRAFGAKARPSVNTSQLTEKRRSGALAMKVGMLSIWDKWGERHAVTVLQLDNCQVVQVKKEETEGYCALQLGVGEAKSNRVKISTAGHFKAAGDLTPNRKLMEFRVTPDSILPVGTKISSMHFVPGQVRENSHATIYVECFFSSYTINK